jgi:hypothetical protein
VNHTADLGYKNLKIEYSADNGTTWSTTYPTKIGVYKVRATYTGSKNFNADATGAEITLYIDNGALELDTSDPDLQTTAPVIDPGKDTTFVKSQAVAISAEKDATIYYTLDGTTPTTSSTKYTGAFTITETTTVKAIAKKDDQAASAVVSVTFTKGAGIVEEDGVLRAYDENGKLVKGAFTVVDDKSYYADEDGVVMAGKIFTVGKSKYYATKSGMIRKGGVYNIAGGGKVYAKADGKLLVSASVDVGSTRYVADKNGRLVKSGFTTTKKGYKYYVVNYKVVKNKKFTYSNGKTYIAQKNGVIAVNKVVSYNGKKYVAQKTGVLALGKSYTIGKKTYTTSKKGVITKTTTK